MKYLEDIELARQLKEQGHHSKTEILSSQFEAKKKAVKEALFNQNKDKTKSVAHTEITNKEKMNQSSIIGGQDFFAANDSQNFKVNANASNGEQGLLFRNKRDRKVINVDPKKKLEDNMSRIEIDSPDYTQIVLYDLSTRRKN